MHVFSYPWRMNRAVAAVVVLGACSFGMQGVDPKWDGKSEPVCSNGTVMLDRVMGAAFLVPGISTLLADQDEPHVLVGVPVTILGLLFELSATIGANKFVECQQARTQWTYSNAIKSRGPAARGPAPSVADAAVSRPAVIAAQTIQRSKGNPGSRPWAAGVSDAEQAIALELYSAGNGDFIQRDYGRALAKYKQAIQHWDHPAIRFNIAVCLIELDQPLEARANLERSLAYGDRALGAQAYAQALTYRKLLDTHLVRLTIHCPEPDEEVMLDGKVVFTGPGVVDQFVMPGEHHLVATKPGFLPASKKIVVTAGTPATYEIRPFVDPRPPP